MQKRKFISFLLIIMLCAMPLCLFGCEAEGGTEELVVYNWAEYIDPALIEEFEAYYLETTGREIKVTYSTFDTNETMLTKLLRGDANIDLTCPSEYAIQKLIVNDALLPINFDNLVIDDVNTYDNVDSTIPQVVAEVFDNQIYTKDGVEVNITDYFVPYMTGTLGILYNTEFVTEEELAEEGWGILWNSGNNPDVANRILMKDSVRDAYVAATLYLREQGRLPAAYDNYSVQELINTLDEDVLKLAEEAFIEQKANLRGYEVDLGKDDMIALNAYVDLAWSGDAMYAIEEAAYEDIELGYYVPESGANLWFDGWVMPKTCKNVAAAEMFIAFMNTPYNAMCNMMEIGYTSAVSKEVIMADEDALMYLVECYFDEESEEDMAALDALYEQWDSEGFDLTALDEDIQAYVEEYFTWDVRYPTVTDKLGVMKDFGNQNPRIISMWESVKATGTWNNGVAWLILGICILILGSFFLFVYLKNNVFYSKG